MKKIKITVMRQTIYTDLMEKYENPIEHLRLSSQVQQLFEIFDWRKKTKAFTRSIVDQIKNHL